MASLMGHGGFISGTIEREGIATHYIRFYVISTGMQATRLKSYQQDHFHSESLRLNTQSASPLIPWPLYFSFRLYLQLTYQLSF